MFCENCGKEISNDAKFCRYCGSSTSEEIEETEEKKEETQRKQIYEGDMHKCPNCGELLKSFLSNCPACGHEVRNVQISDSIKELTTKLEKVDLREMPRSENKSFLKKTFGIDLKELNGYAEAERKEFEEQKEKDKANIIKNFPIPNAKEDVLEFMILASSNMDKKVSKGIVYDAWKSKFEQAYQKAKLLFKDERIMIEIEQMHEKVKKPKWKIW